MKPTLYKSNITSLPLLSRGKVRDIYLVNQDKLLIVTTDRISAFDFILPDPVPGKGVVLKKLTDFWLKKLEHIIPNHSTKISPEEVVSCDEIPQVIDRAVVVKKLKPIMIEAVVRGYIIGSGWLEYTNNKSICGINLPTNLKLADKLDCPIFTPAIKAEVGDHDQNINFDEFKNIVGVKLADDIRDVSLQLYKEAASYALEKGIIIADTKFEFGLDKDGTLCLMDEILTPDSSRFWSLKDYTPGTNPNSFDKQNVRDWLDQSGWDKISPSPTLPKWLIEKTSLKYSNLLSILTS